MWLKKKGLKHFLNSKTTKGEKISLCQAIDLGYLRLVKTSEWPINNMNNLESFNFSGQVEQGGTVLTLQGRWIAEIMSVVDPSCKPFTGKGFSCDKSENWLHAREQCWKYMKYSALTRGLMCYSEALASGLAQYTAPFLALQTRALTWFYGQWPSTVTTFLSA